MGAPQENFIKPGFPSVFGLTLIGLISSLICAYHRSIILVPSFYHRSIIVLSSFYHRSIIVLSSFYHGSIIFYHGSIMVLSSFYHCSIMLPSPSSIAYLLVPSLILHPGFGSY